MKAQPVNFERGQDPKDALDLGIGNKLRMEGIDALTHFLYYADHDFIEKAWRGSPLVNHLREKLTNSIYGPGGKKMNPNALLSFIRELDTENQEILYKYIAKNHTTQW